MSETTHTRSRTRMSYDIVYTADGSEAINQLEPTERQQVREKLNEIAHSPFRDPWDWDFCRMEGCADGRFSIGKGLRVYADIDAGTGVIRIHHVGRRENLYA